MHKQANQYLTESSNFFGTVPPVKPEVSSGARSDTVKLILASLLGGAAVGGTVAGISGLHKLTNKPEAPSNPDQLDLELPYPAKQASADSVHPAGYNVVEDMIPVGSKKWLFGEHAASPADWWPTIPGVIGGGLLGALGTAGLVHHLMRQKRKSMLDEELQNANDRFRSSMLGQFKPETTHELKSASTDSIDDVYNELEKVAALGFSPDPSNADATLSSFKHMPNWTPLLAGGGLTVAGLLGYLAAKGGYTAAEGYTQEDLLAKALKQKAYLQSLRSPPPISFEAKPVQVSASKEQ